MPDVGTTLAPKNMTNPTLFRIVTAGVCAALWACSGSSSRTEADSTRVETEGFSFNFSKGAKLDGATGAKTRYNGFSIESVYIVDSTDTPMDDNRISLDNTFAIVYEGIDGYTLENGNAFPGLSLQVTDAAGGYILNEPDLFGGSTDGYDPGAAAVLRGTVTTGKPMKRGETYHCVMRIFDKRNAESEIVTEMDFTID